AGINLQPAFEEAADGPLDRLGVNLNLRSSAGQVSGTLTADLSAPRYGASGTVSVQHLNLAPLLKDPKQASDISGNAAIDLQADSLSNRNSIRGSIKVDAPKVIAAGYVVDHLTGTALIKGRHVDVDA